MAQGYDSLLEVAKSERGTAQDAVMQSCTVISRLLSFICISVYETKGTISQTSTMSSSSSNLDSVTIQLNRYLSDLTQNEHWTHPVAIVLLSGRIGELYTIIALIEEGFCRLQPHKPLWKEFLMCVESSLMSEEITWKNTWKLECSINSTKTSYSNVKVLFTALDLMIVWKSK